MRIHLLIIFLFIITFCYSQTSLESPYQHKMDSIGLSNLRLKYSIQSYNNHIKSLALRRAKITFATRVNTADLSNLYSECDGNLGDVFNDASTSDYLSLFKYDIRAKFYLTRDIRFITRAVIMGTKYKSNQYSAGFIIKF